MEIHLFYCQNNNLIGAVSSQQDGANIFNENCPNWIYSQTMYINENDLLNEHLGMFTIEQMQFIIDAIDMKGFCTYNVTGGGVDINERGIIRG